MTGYNNKKLKSQTEYMLKLSKVASQNRQSVKARSNRAQKKAMQTVVRPAHSYYELQTGRQAKPRRTHLKTETSTRQQLIRPEEEYFNIEETVLHRKKPESGNRKEKCISKGEISAAVNASPSTKSRGTLNRKPIFDKQASTKMDSKFKTGHLLATITSSKSLQIETPRLENRQLYLCKQCKEFYYRGFAAEHVDCAVTHKLYWLEKKWYKLILLLEDIAKAEEQSSLARFASEMRSYITKQQSQLCENQILHSAQLDQLLEQQGTIIVESLDRRSLFSLIQILGEDIEEARKIDQSMVIECLIGCC